MSEDKGWSIGRVLDHPVTAISTGIAFVTGGLGLDPLFAVLSGVLHFVGVTAGTWFPLLGVVNSIASMLSIIPVALAQKLFLGGAVVYAAFLVYRLIKRTRKMTQ